MFSPLFYIALLLIFLLVPGFIISIWFLFQRKRWQRIVACLFGADIYLLALTGTLPRMGSYHEIEVTHKLYFELVGFAWMVLMILLPGKSQTTTQTLALEEKQNWNKMSAATLLFSIQFVFKFLAIVFDFDTLFKDSWEKSYSNINMCILLVFLGGLFLFYLRKNTGWLLILSYFVYLELSSLSYILWLIWVKNTQVLYKVHLSAFSVIYVFYYGWCLYFLFQKDVAGNFSISKKRVITALIITSVLSLALFWNNYHH